MQELLPPLDAQVEELLARIDALKDEVKFAEAELFAFRRAQTQTKGHPAKAETDILQMPADGPGGTRDYYPDKHLTSSSGFKHVSEVGQALSKLEMIHGLRKDEKDVGSRGLQQAVIRGIMYRGRYLRCASELQNLQENLIHYLLQPTRHEILRQRRFDDIILAHNAELAMWHAHRCLEAWRNEALMRRKYAEFIRTTSLAVITRRCKVFLHIIVRAWRRECIGPRSRRNSQQRRLKLLREARNEIQERERRQMVNDKKTRFSEQLLITNEMVKCKVSQDIYRKTLKRRVWWCLYHHFLALREVVKMEANALALAIKFNNCIIYRRVFIPWTDYLHASPNTGLERARWPRPRCYQPLYSQVLVDRFVRRHSRRNFVLPFWTYWRQYHSARKAERVLSKHNNSRISLSLWNYWRKATVRRIELRSMAVRFWRETGRQLLVRPLRAWYVHTHMNRVRRSHQDRLALTHARSHARRICQKLFRAWHHQAVYGRVEGLYTRTELVRCLAELRGHSRRLEMHAERHSSACEEAIHYNLDACDRARLAATRLKKCSNGATRKTLAIHRAETEINRIGSVIECIAKLQPVAVRQAMVCSLYQQSTRNVASEVVNLDSVPKLPFKPESSLHELVHDGLKVTRWPPADIIPRSKLHRAHSSSKNFVGKQSSATADVEPEVCMLRARFILDQPAADFRENSHFRGRELYDSNYQGSSVDKLLKIARDLQEGLELWDFLVYGDASNLSGKHLDAWKDTGAAPGDI